MKAKIILFYLLLTLSVNLKAQYVTIPDARFANQLNLIIPGAMIGNQMDTTHIDVTSLTSLSVTFDTICDLYGIQYFTSLQTLDCSGNNLDTLVNLPNTLQTLICYYNQLIFLPSIPNSIFYLNCSQNMLDSIPPLPLNLTYLDCHNNQLTNIPSLPFSLTHFDCSGNQLTILPSLPPNLPELICDENQLDSLPFLPSTLTSIQCEHNQITSLPSLPLGLISLNCGYNLLTSLPTLPTTLSSLSCYYNQLTLLPTLPSSLVSLICGGNLLTILPTLPSSLITLICYSNSLPFLPVLPGSLEYLDCNTNSITSLPALPSSLLNLDCSANLIVALPALSSALTFLNCNYNQLTALPTLTSMLQTLHCSFNYLATIPSLPGSLTHLMCSHNPLDSLPTLSASLFHLECSYSTLDSLPSIPNSLSFLSCAANTITNLPASLNTINQLWCGNNLLTTLPPLPNSLTELYCENNNINCFDEFPNSLLSISLYNNPFTCLPNYIPAMDSITLLYPLCVDGDFVNNPYGCAGAQGIVGFTYTDLNLDCLKDSLDSKLINIPVRILDNSGTLIGQTYTAFNGVYHFPEPAGIYTIVVDTVGLPITPQCPAPGIDSTISVSIVTPLTTDVNFNFNCKPGFDIGVQSIITCGLVFPGESHSLRILAGDMTQWYHLACAAGISGQVKITVTGPVSYNGILAGALTPIVTGSVYTYSIADFAGILNTKAFGLNFTTLTTAGSGSPICVDIDVTPLGGDNDSTNNHFHYCYEVRNSHDPNFKETTPEIFAFDYDDYFTYTIHFQNTGSAPAINIHLQDTLDSDLDLSTFQVINYSHENIVELKGNALTILYPNIMLADSTTSADSSSGYFQYRIKRKTGLTLPILIHNTAYIYFDYNEAVVTNTTSNVCRPGVVAGINENASNSGVIAFPNPSTGIFNLNLSGFSIDKESTVQVYNLIGELIINQSISKNSLQINLTDESAGIYIVKIIGSTETFIQRIIKN